MPQTLFHYSLYPRTWIESARLRTICNSAFRNFVTSEKDDFENFLAEKQPDVQFRDNRKNYFEKLIAE